MAVVKRYVGFAILGLLLFALAVSGLLVWAFRMSSPSDNAAASEHAHQGITLMQQHLYFAAIDEFEEAIRQSPRALDAWVGLSAIYIRLGDAPKALDRAAKAVNLAENSADVQLILGRAHWLARNFNDAEDAALKVDQLDPSNLQAAELLLHIYFEQKKDDRFREILDRTTSPTPSIQDLAVQFAVRQSEFRRAYELRNSFDRPELEKSILRAQLALKRAPQQTDLYPQLLKELVRLGRHDEALSLRRSYRGPIALDMEIGKAYWLAGNRNEAIRAFTLASRGAHKLSAEIALAAITGDRRHWAEAFRAEWIERDYFVLALLEDLLQSGTPLDKALIYRYAGLFDNDLFNKAAENALAALNSQPDQFEALMTLGTAYSRVGRVDDAIRYVKQGAELHPERAEVWSRLGQMALMKNDPVSGEENLRRAVQLEPVNSSYLYNYAWLLDRSDRDSQAVPYYERAIAASFLSFEAMNNLALLEADKGRSDRALVLLNRAVVSNPENDGTYVNRGNYCAVLKRWREALSDYAHALRLNPFNVIASVESARVHLEINRADIAIEELNAALDIDPHVHDAYILLATAYEKLGRTAEATAAMNEAKRLKDLD